MALPAVLQRPDCGKADFAKVSRQETRIGIVTGREASATDRRLLLPGASPGDLSAGPQPPPLQAA